MNWLGLMNPAFAPDLNEKAFDLRPNLRRSMIEMVLSTDPTKHNALMEDLKGLVQVRGLIFVALGVFSRCFWGVGCVRGMLSRWTLDFML